MTLPYDFNLARSRKWTLLLVATLAKFMASGFANSWLQLGSAPLDPEGTLKPIRMYSVMNASVEAPAKKAKAEPVDE